MVCRTGKGKHLLPRLRKSNVAKTTTLEMFGTDTLYLHSVLLRCQECVKVDLGKDIYTGLSSAGGVD